MQTLRALTSCDLLEPRAQAFVGRGTWKQASGQGAVVKAGSTHEDGQAPPAMDVTNRPLSVLGEACRRIDLDWIGDIDQMMWNAPPLFERELVGADIEPPVDGSGIAIDDLAVEQRGKRQAEGALP